MLENNNNNNNKLRFGHSGGETWITWFYQFLIFKRLELPNDKQ